MEEPPGSSTPPVTATTDQPCVRLLRTHAPTWLREMPALVSEAELEAVQRRAAGAAPGRMLRELAEALEAITAERPLVLVLEDLHWSDHATLDLLAYLARRPEPARLLLVATYRPVEIIVRGHPLAAVAQELSVRGFAEELALELLTEADVARYLASRAPVAIEGSEAERLARTLHQRTDGHPLFMVTVVEALARRQVLGSEGWNVPGAVEAVTREVPESLRQLIEQQLDNLDADAYGRARELCRRLGDPRKLFPVLHGLRRFYTGQNDHETALELGEEMLRLAQGADDRALLLEAHFAVGIARVQLGEQTLAYEHFSRGSALDAGRPDVAHIARYGLDTALLCMAHAAQALWMLGFPERAQEWSERAIARMRDHPHALSRVMGLTLSAALEQWLGRAPLVQEHAEAALALAREHGFPFWTASTTVLRGWAVAAQGHDAEGIALMREGLAAYHATGSQIIMSYFASLLGERLLRAGLAGEGLTLITQMQEAALHRGYLYRGELERLRGELLLRSSADPPTRGRSRRRLTHAAEAEACFRQALDIARPRGLKALELRAGMSLARLWQRQGKSREARVLLSEIYGGFTEGLETVDLREARALLDDLAAR